MLQGKGKELEQLSRLMGERNQQIRAFERDLATKEDTIHRLRDQLEEMQVTSDQVRGGGVEGWRVGISTRPDLHTREEHTLLIIHIHLQVAALQKSLKAVEMTSQQQEDFAGRTIHELQEEVNHLTRETFRQEQLLNSLWKERERATRDQEVKVCIPEKERVTHSLVPRPGNDARLTE